MKKIKIYFLKNYHVFFLGLIILLTLGLRVYKLDKNPIGFFCDEATTGYNAYTILNTGKDETGTWFPIFFKSLEYGPPIALYSTVPFVAIFGLTEIAVRLQAVFFGIGSIISLYLLGTILFSKKVGLWSAFSAATLPWLIHYNRVGFDYNCYVFFYILSLYILIRQIKNNNNLLPGFLLFGFSLYTYQPARLILPLSLFLILFVFRKKIAQQKKQLILGVLIFVFVALPLLTNMFEGPGIQRFNQISIFSQKLPLKETFLLSLDNYVSQVSPTFFLFGEKTFITRHFIKGLNPFLYISIPFIILGLILLLLNIKKTSSQIILLLLSIYPLGAALVASGPFTGRTIIGAPLFSLIIGYGISSYLELFKHKLTKTLSSLAIILLIFLNLIQFLFFYFGRYPLLSADFWGWQYGAKDIVGYFVKNESQYDQLIMAPEFNAPEIFFKFYAPNDCKKCLIGLPETNLDPQKRQLFAVTPDYLSKNPGYKLSTKKIIYYPNGSIAFRIGEIVK